jgi:hypothetical protein
LLRIFPKWATFGRFSCWFLQRQYGSLVYQVGVGA